MSSSTTTTVRAASSATPSVASAAAVVARREVALHHRVAAAQEVVRREAPPRVTQAVVAVAPAVMTMAITIHRAVVAEAAEDDLFWIAFGKKSFKNQKQNL